MADGQWGTLTIAVPDFLEDVRQAINSVAEFLIAVLDVALAALQLAKTFLVGFLNPIAALVQAIIDEINALLRDLRQLGVYLTGDWKELEYPYDHLLGGFAGYERRMIARLVDRTDPTRPDLSSRSLVFALFLYLSVDVSEILRLIRFIKQILAFFKQSYRVPGSLPVPKITDIRYGADATSITSAKSLSNLMRWSPTPPAMALVKWGLVNTAARSPFNPFPPVAPEGFLVTVSTLPEGIRVVYDRPIANETLKESVTGGMAQPREYGPVRIFGTGEPLVLYGDTVANDLPVNLNYNTSLQSDGTIKHGRTRIYGTVGSGEARVIPLETMKSGDTYYFQRTFSVTQAPMGISWGTGEFTITLDATEMPHDGRVVTGSNGQMTVEDLGPASVLYVRVASCSALIGEDPIYYGFDFSKVAPMAAMAGAPLLVPTLETTGPDDVGAWSEPRQVVFPNTNTAAYLEAIKAALAVLVLARPDLVPLDEIEGVLPTDTLANVNAGKLLLDGVAMQRCGLEGVRHLTDILYEDYRAAVAQKGISPIAARKDLFDRINRVATAIYDATGPLPNTEAAVVRGTELLRALTWGDVFRVAHPSVPISLLPSGLRATKIFDSLDVTTSIGASLTNGVALNPYCAGIPEDVARDLLYVGGAGTGIIYDRTPQMMEALVGQPERNWLVNDSVPIHEVPAFLDSVAPALRRIYQQFIQSDGSISIPADKYDAINAMATTLHREGSADMSPVFVLNRDRLETLNRFSTVPNNCGLFYTRGLLAKVDDGRVLQEAALALGAAAAALTRPLRGEWLAYRFIKSMPGVENFLQSLINWVEAIRAALGNIIDTILKYIGFLEARIVEMQQLIRRINALIQNILGFAFQIPKCSALATMSYGTDGLLAGLLAAENKPSDSPLAYGAGMVLVFPVPGAALIMELLRAFLQTSSGDPGPTQTLAAAGPPFGDAFGIETLPAPAPDPPEPDVL